MSLPQIPYTQRRKEPQITEFRGVNYRDGIRDGEMQFTENMSSRRFPFLSPRQDRLPVRLCYAPQAVWAGDKLVLVDNGLIYYDVVNEGGPAVVGSTSGGPKQFAAINSKLVIWPDKQFIDLNTGTLKDLEAKMETEDGDETIFRRDNKVEFTGRRTYEAGNKTSFFDIEFVRSGVDSVSHYYFICYGEGDISFSDGVWTLPQEDEVNAQTIYEMGTAERSGLVGKTVMLRNGTTALNLRYVGTEDGVIVDNDPYADNSADGLYAKITKLEVRKDNPFPGATQYSLVVEYNVYQAGTQELLSEQFSIGDTVTVEQVPDPHQIFVDHGIIREIDDETNTLTFDPGTFADLFDGTAADEITTYNAIRVKRTVPDMDFICASENRLWGVSNTEEGQVWDKEKKEYVTVHNRVIHASALGDPMNFYVYDGLSTDSYSVAVAEPGDFTGCVGFSGDVLLFKERKLYRIYGDYPATYMMYTYDVPGITAGSHMSVGIVNDTLFYLSREGVHVWDGASAHLVSYKLGPGPFSDGVAGVCGTRYYLSAKEGDAWSLHVYDTLHDVWYREDDTQAIGFAEHAGNFYMLHDQTLDKLEMDSAAWHITEEKHYSRYLTGYLLKHDFLSLFEEWDPARYYGLSGLPDIKFRLPYEVMDFLDDGSFQWVQIEYDTQYDYKLGMNLYHSLVFPEKRFYKTVYADPEAGTGSKILAAAKDDYTVTVEHDNPGIEYRQSQFHFNSVPLYAVCWRYSGTGTLTAGTYHFRTDETTWQFTSTEDVNLDRYNIVLYGNSLRRCRKAGGYSTMSWGLREGAEGTELAFSKESTAFRFRLPEGDNLDFTLPYDLAQGRQVIYNTMWPDRLDVQLPDSGDFMQVPVQTAGAYYEYATDISSRAQEYQSFKGPANWRAVLATADEVIHEKKHYRWIRLRVGVTQGSTLRVYAAIGGGEDRLVYTLSQKQNDTEGTINIPLKATVRNDKIRITLEGIGDVTIKSVVRAYNIGSVNTK